MIGLRYKLRMMVVTTDNTKHIYGDNMSVIDTSKLESTLKKTNAAESQLLWGKP